MTVFVCRNLRHIQYVCVASLLRLYEINRIKTNSVVGLQSVTPIYWRYTSLLRAFVDTAQYCRRKKTEQKSNVVAVVV